MNKEAFEFWKSAVLDLQKAEEMISKTKGYTQEVAQLRVLRELIKEQYPDEDFDSTARQVR